MKGFQRKGSCKISKLQELSNGRKKIKMGENNKMVMKSVLPYTHLGRVSAQVTSLRNWTLVGDTTLSRFHQPGCPLVGGGDRLKAGINWKKSFWNKNWKKIGCSWIGDSGNIYVRNMSCAFCSNPWNLSFKIFIFDISYITHDLYGRIVTFVSISKLPNNVRHWAICGWWNELLLKFNFGPFFIPLH